LDLNQHPFTTSLDEFIQHHGDVGKDKATNVETEELCGVARGQLETNVCGGGMLETWVFDLAGDLVWGSVST
jgi:hypothetical protein